MNRTLLWAAMLLCLFQPNQANAQATGGKAFGDLQVIDITIEIAADEPVHATNRDAEFSRQVNSAFTIQVTSQDFLVAPFFFG